VIPGMPFPDDGSVGGAGGLNLNQMVGPEIARQQREAAACGGGFAEGF